MSLLSSEVDWVEGPTANELIRQYEDQAMIEMVRGGMEGKEMRGPATASGRAW